MKKREDQEISRMQEIVIEMAYCRSNQYEIQSDLTRELMELSIRWFKLAMFPKNPTDDDFKYIINKLKYGY